MYTLYYSQGACSMAPHVVLNELNVPFKLENANAPDTKTRSAEFLKINPRGAVPVLSDDGFIIREGAAILIYLLDKHKNPLLPASGKERGAALEWLCFANSTMHPAYSKAFSVGRVSDDKAIQDVLYKSAFEGINKLWADVDAHLAKSKYTSGDNATVADILLTVIANWNGYFPAGAITLGNNVKRLLKDISSRPAYQKALAAEQVEYKAAA